MYYCTCDLMSVCDYVLIFVLYVSVFIIVLLTVAGVSWEAGDAYSMASTWSYGLEYTE